MAEGRLETALNNLQTKHFDDLLKIIGQLGKYQRIRLCLICLVSFVCAFHAQNMVFVGAKPMNICNTPDVNLSLNSWENVTRKAFDRFLRSVPQDRGCRIRSVSQTMHLVERRNYSFADLIEGNVTIDTEPCTSWKYSTNVYGPTIVSTFDLVCDRKWLTSTSKTLYFFGRLVGAAIFGQLADVFGRRPMFLAGLVMLLIVGCAAGGSPNIYVFIPFYILQGAAQTGLFLVGFVMCTELVGPAYRLGAGFLLQGFYAVGYMTLSLLAYIIRDWRLIEVAISVPVIAFSVYWWFVPESVRWLLSKNRNDEAKKILSKVIASNKPVITDEQINFLVEQKVADQCDHDLSGRKYTPLDLIRPLKMAVLSFNVWFNWLVNSLVYYGLGLGTAYLGGDPYINFCIAGAVQIPADIMCILLLNRFGRRIPLCVTMVTGGISCIVSGFLKGDDPVIYISSEDETSTETKFENTRFSSDNESENGLYQPEITQCHLCSEKFYTKSMLRKHIDLHQQNIIHVTGQSVVPVSWIGRQSVFQGTKCTAEDRIEAARAKKKKHLKRKPQTYRNPSSNTVSQPSDVITLSDSTSSSNVSTPVSSPLKKKEKTETADVSFVKRGILLQNNDLDFYDNDDRLPVILRDSKGVQTKDAVNFIINESNFEKHQIATVVPTDIRENVAFLVNTNAIGSWKNVLSDDMGAWKSTCVANRYYKWDGKGELQAIAKTEFESGCYHVFRHQYVNQSSPDLHRIIVRVSREHEIFNTLFLQYYFEADEHRVIVNPHGNRQQDKKPYHRTQETVKSSIQHLAKMKKPKDVFHTILEDSGGIENLTSGSQKPRDKQQIYNFNRKEKSDELLETIDMRINEDIKFIREIEMAPEFAVFLATANQLAEIEKFCTNTTNFSIVGVDTTFNIGQYYVTITTFKNLMLEYKTLQHEPVMIGPTLVHQRRTYDSFFMLPSFMMRENPALANILVYGTDGEVNLCKAFESCFKSAEHLLCDIHMKDNIISKLSSLTITGTDRQTYLTDIFGKQIHDTLIPGLVDCLSESDFDNKMHDLKSVWTKRHQNGSEFYQYFMEYKSELIKKCMSASLRSKCGLGYPPKPYTQNANECINNVVKSDLKSKKQRIPEFIKSFKRTVLRQEAEIKLALTNQSDFKLKNEYHYLAVSEDKYFRMDRKQKESVYKKYLNAALKQRDPSSVSDDTENSGCTETLSITSEHCGITLVPYETLKGLFHKAATLYHSKIDVVPLPGNAGASNVAGKYFVTRSSDMNNPHTITVYHSGQVTCDSSCLMYGFYRICSHALAAAESSCILQQFIEWYRAKCKNGDISINFAQAANKDLPSGRGKKPHKATQVRKGTSNKSKVTVTSYAPSEQSQNKKLPFPRPPDGGYILYFLEDCDTKVTKCYGCKGNLKHDGHIPPSPGNLVLVTRTRRQYIKDGVKTLGEISNVYFHLSENCIRLHNTYFVPSLIYVSPDVSNKLEDKHKDLLTQCNIPY